MEIDKIYLGDCLELMKEIPDKSIDCIICDLPYGTTACAWDSIIPFDKLWAEYKRIRKPNAPIVLFGSHPFTSMVVMSNPSWFKCEWIWQKNAGSNFGCTKYQPMKEHENILVFGSGAITYNPQRQKRADSGFARQKTPIKYNTKTECYAKSLHGTMEVKIPEDRVPSSIQKFNRERGLHPTQKPLDLLRYLVLTYSNEGDLVLDNCIGSGTTAIAAIKEKRHFIGMELNKEYYDIACKRVKDELSSPSLF